MKLGDKMSMEAYNAWRGPAPRKCRPPKIGDIPKHGAVDEESPESCAKKLTLSPAGSRESTSPDNPLDSTRNTAFPLDSTSTACSRFEARKNVPCTGERDTVRSSSTIENRRRSPERDALRPVHPVHREVKDSQGESGYFRDKSYTLRTPSPEYPRPFTETDDPRSRITIRLSSTEVYSRVRVKSPPEECPESPRLPSSPEESGEREFPEVRKDSALFLEEAEGLPRLRELVKTRAPRIVRPRRESSGYASNLGTFDEDRRNSSTPDPLQDLSAFLKERRRSSTKRLNSRIGLVRAEESLTEEHVNCPHERMPTTELYRKVSSAGLEMPNIEEVKEVLREDAAPRQESLDLCNFVESITADELSVRCRNQGDSVGHHALASNDIPMGRDYPRDRTRTDVPGKERDSSRDVFNLTPLSESISSQPTTNSAANLHSRIIHQYSTPYSSEKPGGPEATGNVCSSHDDDDDVSIAVLSGTSLQSRSVKMYQLMSTQSEDAGDADSRFTDRRISLQISRPDDRLLSSTTQSEQFVVSGFEAGTKPKSSLQGESKIQSDEGKDNTPVRKLSSPGEVGVSPSFLGDVSSVTVRPIYPYFPYSPYGSPQGSPRNRRRPLRESRRVSIDNRQGALQLNQYKLLDSIGQGSYGIVKLVYNEEDETHYAMKILSKKKLMKKAGIFGRMAPGRKGAANPLAKVYREIALLKKLDHPNVVKLVEVLDDPDEDNLYLVFELVQKGEVLQVPTDKPLDEETARKNFRDVVMGVEYLHYQRIVHRDIKPSNLLVDSEGRVKIADLGVSAELRASGELLSGLAGTPAFSAPETTTPGAHYSGTLCDIWSMGVTLYSMVTGKIPWDGAGSIIALQEAVRSEPLKFPERPALPADLRDLIARMLEKESARRITLPEIKVHRWLTRHNAEALPSEADNCRLPVTVTDEEVERVVTRVPKLDTLILIKTMLKQHSFQHPFLPKKSGKTTANESSGEDLSSSDRSNVKSRETARNCKSERFQRSGRSNSAPDSYNWQTNGRQISVDSPLPPVTEATCQEAEVERR